MEKYERRILIYPLALSNDAKIVFATAKKDQKLIDAINRKKEYLQQDGIEIFDQVDNIIVTEKGYFAAFYADEKP